MKKFKSFLMASLVTLSVVGCSAPAEETNAPADNNDVAQESQETENGEATEDISATISVQAEAGWVSHYKAAAERVKEKYPNATINIVETGSFDNLEVLDSTDVTNPDVADVFAIPLDRVYGLAQNDVLAAIDAPAMAEALGGFDDYDAGLGGGFKLDGQYLSFPLNIETLVAFANTANAEANGIDLSGTMEFNDLGREGMLSVVHDAWFGVSFTNSVDLTLLDYDESGNLYSDLTKDFAELTADQQALFTTLFTYWQQHDEAGTDLWDKDAAWGYIDSAFTSGNTSSLRIDGPWSTPALAEKTSDGADLQVLPIDAITVNGKPLTHWKGGWGLAVNARLEGLDQEMMLAQEMIKEVVNPEYAIDLFKTTGKILENVSAETYAASELAEADKAVIAATLESYEDAVSRPLFTEWGQVWPTWQNGLLSWAASKPTNVEEAYEQVQASFVAMMANF